MLLRVLRPLHSLLILVILSTSLPNASSSVPPYSPPLVSDSILSEFATETTRGQHQAIVLTASPEQPVKGPKPPATQIDIHSLPLAFIPNRGQSDASVRFQAHTAGGSLFFTPGAVTLALPVEQEQQLIQDAAQAQKQTIDATSAQTPMIIQLRFEGTSKATELRGDEQQPGKVNILTGGNKTKWQRNLPSYAGLIYRNLYAGIDLTTPAAPVISKEPIS